MISLELKIAALFSLTLYFVWLIYLLCKKVILLRYTLMWIFTGIFMGIFILFPKLLEIIAKIIGIEVASNAVFAMVLFLVLLILMELTSIASKISVQNKELVQAISLLEKRVRNMEKKENITGVEDKYDH